MATPRTGQTSKKDSAVTANGRPKVEWKGYVTYEIDTAAKAVLQKFIENGNDPINWLAEIAIDGTYEVKTRYDSYNECFVTNLYCIKYGHVNAGWSLPVRASDYWESQRRAAFVHVEVLQRNWGVGEQKKGWTDDSW